MDNITLAIILCFVAGLILGVLAERSRKDDKIVAATRDVPEAGELWVIKQFNRGPWPIAEYKPVRVRDVRGGWVRYEMGAFFPDERKTVEDFTRIYRKAP